MRIQRFRRLLAIMATVACVSALSLIGTSSASAVAYNCGNIPAGGMCNPPLSNWGAVYWATHYSSTMSGTLPVRVFGGSSGSTAWQYVHEGNLAFFPWYPVGVAQVKNNTGRTQQLTIEWGY